LTHNQLLIFSWFSLVFACVHSFFLDSLTKKLACFIVLLSTPSTATQYAYKIFETFLTIFQ